MKIKVLLPTKETAGFLRRAKTAASFSQRLQKEVTPELFDELVEFLLPFVAEPENRDEAREALWDASKEQFQELMKAFGGGNDTTVPPLNSAPPENTSLQTA